MPPDSRRSIGAGSGGTSRDPALAPPSGQRPRRSALLLTIVVAIVVPPLLVTNALRVLATETFVRAELSRDGFPDDPYGLHVDARERLALVGLRSIEPRSEGIVLLERERLPDGTRAFGERELAHMADVRSVFVMVLVGQLVVLAILVVLGLALARTGLRTALPRGLLAGSLVTLGIAVLAVPFMLLGFDRFFTRFHEVFFEGDSWRFSTRDMLIRLYPEQLWQDVSILAAALTVGQAVVVGLLSWWWLRTLRRREG